MSYYNVPDDWGSYYYSCGCHASEGGCSCPTSIEDSERPWWREVDTIGTVKSVSGKRLFPASTTRLGKTTKMVASAKVRATECGESVTLTTSRVIAGTELKRC